MNTQKYVEKIVFRRNKDEPNTRQGSQSAVKNTCATAGMFNSGKLVSLYLPL
jgi:hypothetical protein